MRLLGLGLLGLTLVGCARFPTPTPGANLPTQVVIVSQAGKLATSTPRGGGATPILPTPTFDPSFSSVLTPLARGAESTAAAAATGTAISTATALSRPTRTPIPTATPYPTLAIPPAPPLQGIRRDFEPPPTRTPAPPTRTAVPRPSFTPTKTATAAPEDPTGDNSSLALALPIGTGVEEPGLLNGPKAVDVFAFNVAEADQVIVVTLSARDPDAYRLYLISPGRQQAAFGRPVGGVTRRIRYPARSELGTWYIEVTTDGKRAPAGGYTIRVDLRAPAATFEDF